MGRPAARTPCAACPWRRSNQGKPHPNGWYTKANLRRLWKGLRRCEPMSCHPTDPHNPVTPEDEAAGNKGKGRRKGKRAASKASAHDTRRMAEPKPKPTEDTMRGGFKPSWEEDR